MARPTWCLLLLVLLAGCSGATGYNQARPLITSRFGYQVQRIGLDEYSIVVHGNSSTSLQKVLDIALLRAARLTHEAGRTHFLILQQRNQRLEAAELLRLGQVRVLEPMAILLIRLQPAGSPPQEGSWEAAALIRRLAPLLQ